MIDCAINTWDLARSIGANALIDDPSIEPLIEFASDFFPKVRERTDHARFGLRASTAGADATALERLVALSGRGLDWSAG